MVKSAGMIKSRLVTGRGANCHKPVMAGSPVALRNFIISKAKPLSRWRERAGRVLEARRPCGRKTVQCGGIHAIVKGFALCHN
jgi:hypothetical protein